jgi:outer membrane receptor for ferrienterochelin and colicin
MRRPLRKGRDRIDCRSVFKFRACWSSLLFLLWMALVSPQVAIGQTQDIVDLSPEVLRNIQVYSASMYMQSDREAPSSVTVISAEQIRQFGYRTLADALRSVLRVRHYL